MGEFEKMKRERDKAKKELYSTQEALTQAMKEKSVIERQTFKFSKKIDSLEMENDLYCNDLEGVKDIYMNVEKQNSKQEGIIEELQKELSLFTEGSSIIFDADSMTFSFQTKCNKKQYSPSVRKLYYSLMADQIPPKKFVQLLKQF